MNTNDFLTLAAYTIPALITGGTAYYFLTQFTKSENNRRKFEILRENQKHALPLRLQAYERMTLFLERIDPVKLLIRVAPISEVPADYANFLAEQIEQEFDHNMTQQIYMSDKCWGVVLTAKNATIQLIRKAALDAEVKNAQALREKILKERFDNVSPSAAALSFIRSEVQNII